jgi:hypothetical protein
MYAVTTNRFQTPAASGGAQAAFFNNGLGQITGMRWTQSGATTLYSKKRLPSKLSIRRNGSEVRLALRGDTGVNYVIEASEDLGMWSALSTNTIWDSGIVDLVGSNSSRFYRVREP